MDPEDAGREALTVARLLEADCHVRDAHQLLRRQRVIVEELAGSGSLAHSAVALLALMFLILPILEDLRLDIVRQLASALA